MELDRSRICKLLNLTKSSNEHEANLAMKMANDLLSKSGKDWSWFLKIESEHQQQKPRYEPQHHNNSSFGRYYHSDFLDEVFDKVLTNVNDLAFDFIDSLNNHYNKRGYLTKKQYDALMKFFENIR